MTAHTNRGRRDEILELFTRFVAERGYDGTNLGDLAAELGISKGTIVHHFTTKDRMLAELHETYMENRLAEAEILLAAVDTPVEQLAALIHAFILYQQEDRLATIAFQRETVRFRGDDVMAGSQQLRQRYFTMVCDVLQRGMDQGAFREGDTSLIARAIFGAAQWAWTWFDPDGRATPEGIAAAFVELFLLGLATDPDTAHQRTSDARRMSTLVRSAVALAANRHQQSPTSR